MLLCRRSPSTILTLAVLALGLWAATAALRTRMERT